MTYAWLLAENKIRDGRLCNILLSLMIRKQLGRPMVSGAIHGRCGGGMELVPKQLHFPTKAVLITARAGLEHPCLPSSGGLDVFCLDDSDFLK